MFFSSIQKKWLWGLVLPFILFSCSSSASGDEQIINGLKTVGKPFGEMFLTLFGIILGIGTILAIVFAILFRKNKKVAQNALFGFAVFYLLNLINVLLFESEKIIVYILITILSIIAAFIFAYVRKEKNVSSK
ncbi:MAG: hypothetical protein GY810_30320 [Aureispira sp.]|nr:hypothetical protein [Aureispira sp.]